MIIFGSRGMARLLATLTLVCRNCHNPAAQQLVRHATWFTLFFIPVFPIRVRRTLTCTYCGVTTKLSKAEAEQLAGGPQGPVPPQQFPAGQPQGYGPGPHQG